jgi:hypothetical protein
MLKICGRVVEVCATLSAPPAERPPEAGRSTRGVAASLVWHALSAAIPPLGRWAALVTWAVLRIVAGHLADRALPAPPSGDRNEPRP